MIEDIESATPALCRLQLGAEFRRLRREAGMKSSQVAKRLLWSPSKVTRVEYGDNSVVEPDDAAALCGVYGADTKTRSLLKDYAMVTKTKHDRWASSGDRPDIAPTFHAYLGLESSAVALRSYASDYVPGLLQTEAYARAIHTTASRNYSAEEIELRVSIRMERQRSLYREEAPLEVFFILNESVLRRHAGSSAVAREQLQHIADASTLRNVRVQVLPFSLGIHMGMNGPFTIIRFAKSSTMRPIVFMENMAGSWVISRESVIDNFKRAFDELQALAPRPHEARQMIGEMIKEV